MARFISSVCDEAKIPLTCFDIDYFEESESFKFIQKYFEYNGIHINQKQKQRISEYLNHIKLHLGSNDNEKYFLGYAQVLCILARQIELEYGVDKTLDNLHELVLPSSNNYLIYDIIQQLITREQDKLQHFKNSIREKYIPLHKEKIVDSLYCKNEQLIRLHFFASAKSVDSIAIDDYANCTALLPEDQVRYLNLLRDWLPQHVFLRGTDILPVFDDYLFAESLLNDELGLFEGEYQYKLPTRVFMDCYLSLNNGTVNSEHIYYLDLSFSSQARSRSKAYCDISSISDTDDAMDDSGDQLSLYLSLTSDGDKKDMDILAKINREANAPIRLCRAENMSVSVNGRVELTSSFLDNVTIREAFIECDELDLNATEVLFETYDEEENYLIIHHSISRMPGGKITLRGTQKLNVQLPSDNIEEYKRQFYEFVPYICSITSEEEKDGCDEIEQFIHALKKVLEQFKVDKYDGDPAKHKEKIDARCHTGCKARVLAFAKSIGLIYEDGIMYKASLEKMDELQISRVAYSHFNYEQLRYAYSAYCNWYEKCKGRSVGFS